MANLNKTIIHDRVLICLRQIIRAVDLYSRKLVKNYNLTGPQLTVLRELHTKGSCPISQLSKQVHLSNATVTGILDRLEKRDLIRRVRDSRDRRKIFINITVEAEKLLQNAPSLLQDDFLDAFDQIPRSEQMEILSSLEKLSSMMSAEKLDAAPMLLLHPIPIHEMQLRDRAVEDEQGLKIVPGDIDGS